MTPGPGIEPGTRLDTLVEGERYHHYTNPAPRQISHFI